MNFDQTLGRLNRVQHDRRFKWIATSLIAVAAAVLVGAVLLIVNGPNADANLSQRMSDFAAQNVRGLEWLEQGPVEFGRYLWNLLVITASESGGMVSVAFGVLAVAGVSIVVVWLGLGLTYLGVLVAVNVIAWPLMMAEPTRGIGQLIFAVAPLVLAFVILMQLLRVLFSATNPVIAVARNVLSEAVRMKISLVFIVILLLFLALVPGLLNVDQPLRYRVQQWLQYSVGLSYAVLAFLTLFLSAATVAYEQRDRIIWQTMSKPVAPWQYVLGKWIGVMGLNAVLLTVTATGSFLFTEYLRHQPARGEMSYMVTEDGVPGVMTEDRRLLEDQVLVARVGRKPLKYDAYLKERGISDEDLRSELMQELDDRVTERAATDPTFEDTPAERQRLFTELYTNRVADYRTIDRGDAGEFVFIMPEIRSRIDRIEEQIAAEVDSEVAERRAQDPNAAVTDDDRLLIERRVTERFIEEGRYPNLTLRYQIQAGSNDPSQIYQVEFLINGVPTGTRPVALKTTQSFEIPSFFIDDQGRFAVTIYNFPQNPRALNIPPDGLEIMYVAGGYQLNFFRILSVIWLKLGFIAAIAIATATFLNFPVACLVSLAVLFMAESAGFLEESLEQYTFLNSQGQIDWKSVPIRIIAAPVAWLFGIYAELRPTANLVEGRLVGWGGLVRALMVLGAWALGLLTIGWAIFRRRELALYSGH
ncbi:MAG: hypothetical protein RIB32_03105 [Phycisphaerales bacterium]